MKWNVLVSCSHLQRTIDLYRAKFADSSIEIELPPVKQMLSESELLKIIDRYDGVIAGDDEFTEKVLKKGTNLRVISKWGIGIDAIDLDAAERLGIKVYNTPNVFSEEVADLVMGYIIALARKLQIIDRMVREGKWDEAQIQGISLRGKTLGVIGVGSIGRAVVERAVAAGMSVIGYDICPIPDSFIDLTGIRPVAFDELIQSADFISINCNLTSSNRHLIGQREFAMMKTPVYIINTARGPLVDEEALVKALQEGKVEGAALDVFEEEPLPNNSPLRQFDNCIFGAHNSSNTSEAVMRTNELAIKNLIDGLKDENL